MFKKMGKTNMRKPKENKIVQVLDYRNKDGKGTKNKTKNPIKLNVQHDESADPDNIQEKITNENNFNVKENNRYTCDNCGKDYEGKSELIAHIIAYRSYNITDGASKTNLNMNRPLILPTLTCNSKSATKSGLINQDIKIHDLKINYKSCNQCDYKTAKRCNLMKHIRRHSDLKPYMCTVCDVKFKTNRSLKVHTRSHTGSRPYECNVCDAKFTTNSRLKVHLRIHRGDKP